MGWLIFQKVGFCSSGNFAFGTLNVFARELGLPRNLVGAARILEAGREMTMDLGRAEFTEGGRRQGRHFLQLAGAGLDARAVELVSWELKKKTGPLAYIVAGLKALREAQPVITVEGGRTSPASWCSWAMADTMAAALNFSLGPACGMGVLMFASCPTYRPGALSRRFWAWARAGAALLAIAVLPLAHRDAAQRQPGCLQLDGEFAGSFR